MNVNKTNFVVVILLLVFLVVGCSLIKEQTSKITTKTVSLNQMCDAGNVGQTVRVLSFITAPANDTDNITKDGVVYNSYYLVERQKTDAEAREDYQQKRVIPLPKERVVLRRGFDEKAQIIVRPSLSEYYQSTIRTDANELVVIKEKFAFTGKVVMAKGNTNPPGACQLEDVSISKP